MAFDDLSACYSMFPVTWSYCHPASVLDNIWGFVVILSSGGFSFHCVYRCAGIVFQNHTLLADWPSHIDYLKVMPWALEGMVHRRRFSSEKCSPSWGDVVLTIWGKITTLEVKVAHKIADRCHLRTSWGQRSGINLNSVKHPKPHISHPATKRSHILIHLKPALRD